MQISLHLIIIQLKLYPEVEILEILKANEWISVRKSTALIMTKVLQRSAFLLWRTREVPSSVLIVANVFTDVFFIFARHEKTPN